MTSQREKAKRWQFSLWELALIMAGASVLVVGLSVAGRQTGHHWLFYAIYSQPVVLGLGGLLRWQLRGGIVGALIGAGITFTAITVLRMA